MPVMKWNETYSVGIEEIDKQHKVLFEMLNNLYEAMREGKGKDILARLLSELIKYTEYHFKTEEALFSKYHYSNAEMHVKEHNELKTKATELYSAVNAGKASVSLEVFNFLKDWVSVHIMQKDMLYKQEIAEKTKQ